MRIVLLLILGGLILLAVSTRIDPGQIGGLLGDAMRSIGQFFAGIFAGAGSGARG